MSGRSVRSTIVFVHLGGAFVPAGRLDFIGLGDARRANVSDPSAFRSTFEYGRLYLERPDRISLDPVALPLPEPGRKRGTVYQTEPYFELFNGIRDASPDGWGRHIMRRANEAHEYDEFDYLVASGDQRVGALAFGPDPRKPPARITFWDETSMLDDVPENLSGLLEASAQVLSEDIIPENCRRLLPHAISVGGARPKVTHTFRGQHWIAKFPLASDSYPVARAEEAAMDLGRRCGLDIPRTVLKNVSGHPIYMIKRFDRDGERRIPYVSALTMLGAHEMSAHTYAYSDMAQAIRMHGSRPADDLRELFGRMVLNCLVGNDDDHLRNHGFLHDGNGWRLSPGFDITPKPQMSYERRLVLSVGEHGKEATLSNAVSGCAAFGLSLPEATATAEGMRAVVEASWPEACKTAGMSEAELRQIETCFRESGVRDWNSDSGHGL